MTLVAPIPLNTIPMIRNLLTLLEQAIENPSGQPQKGPSPPREHSPSVLDQLITEIAIQSGTQTRDEALESERAAVARKKKRKVSKSQKNFGKALKEAKRKHPRLAKSKSNQSRSKLFKAAWKIAKKMK